MTGLKEGEEWLSFIEEVEEYCRNFLVCSVLTSNYIYGVGWTGEGSGRVVVLRGKLPEMEWPVLYAYN